MKEYKYKAFISHRGTDTKICKKIQQYIETYKFPKEYKLNKEKWKVFLDKTDLPTCASLDDHIYADLENSEYLIIVLTPQFWESNWCKGEVEYFRSLHNGSSKNIIPIILRAEKTEDVILDEICTRTRSLKNGELILSKPRAADLRKGRKRVFVEEMIRVIAWLEHCDFDILWQREKRRENKRKRFFIGILSFLLFIFEFFSLALLIQNIKITNQNARIAAKAATAALENGDKEEAIKTILNIDLYKKGRRLLPDAQRILTNALGLYDYSYEPQLECRIKLDFEITSVEVSSSGQYYMVITNKRNRSPGEEANILYVYSVERSTPLFKAEGVIISACFSSDEKSVIYRDKEIQKVRCVSLEDENILWELSYKFEHVAYSDRYVLNPYKDGIVAYDPNYVFEYQRENISDCIFAYDEENIYSYNARILSCYSIIDNTKKWDIEFSFLLNNNNKFYCYGMDYNRMLVTDGKNFAFIDLQAGKIIYTTELQVEICMVNAFFVLVIDI